MILPEEFEEFIQLLNNHKVEYMVVGGFALALHGRPRYTGDLDIWIRISEKNAEKMVTVLQDFGLRSLGLVKEDFLQENFITQIGYPPLRIDILNNIDGVEFTGAYKNRQIADLNGIPVAYIGMEEFIQNKKAAGRERDNSDLKELQKKPRKKRK